MILLLLPVKSFSLAGEHFFGSRKLSGRGTLSRLGINVLRSSKENLKFPRLALGMTESDSFSIGGRCSVHATPTDKRSAQQ